MKNDAVALIRNRQKNKTAPQITIAINKMILLIFHAIPLRGIAIQIAIVPCINNPIRVKSILGIIICIITFLGLISIRSKFPELTI